MLAVDDATLRAALEVNRNLAEWGAIAVFSGLVGEIIVVFSFTKEKSRAEVWLSFGCTVVIALGVICEYLFGHRATQAGSELQLQSDEKIARMAIEAKQAELDLTREQIARLELETALMPHFLTPREQDEITSDCRSLPHPGIEIVVINPTSGTQRLLGVQIQKALLAAGFSSVKLQTGQTGAERRDLAISGPPEHWEVVKGIATALSAKLPLFRGGPGMSRAGSPIRIGIPENWDLPRPEGKLSREMEQQLNEALKRLGLPR